MKLNKVLKSILSALNLKNDTDIQETYVERIGEIPITSIVTGLEYYEKDFDLTCKFKVTQSIAKDKEGNWTWKAINLDPEIDNSEKTITCKQEGRAYWPNIFAAE